MDFDGDGIKDIITGSWPGEIFLFRGKGKGQFAAKEKILGKDGYPINIGGGVKETDDEILITGDAEFLGEDEKAVVKYNGKTYQSKSKQVLVTGCASAVFVADWNGDGLNDLLVGEARGRVGVYLNTGTAKKYEFDKPEFLNAEGKAISVPHGDAGPVVADWDGDGVADLLVGAGDGSVVFYRNEGTAKKPNLAKGVTLVTAGSMDVDKKEPTKPKRGGRAKICVADYNGDGKLDLLLGDFTMEQPEPKKLSNEEQKKVDEAKKRQEKVHSEYGELVDKLYGPKREKDADELKKMRDKLKTLQTEMTELRKIVPPEYENHGWIWYFERAEVKSYTTTTPK